jgi:AAA+ ATPase superfamily predicted ATPase
LLLDPNPKTRREDLYNREDELSELMKSVSERITVIAAPRRMGKTSVLNIFLSSVNQPNLKIDGRELYVRGVTTYNFLKAIGEGLDRITPFYRRVLDSFKIEGAFIEGLSLRFDHKKTSPLDVMKRLNQFAKKEGKRFIIAVDEAQYLKFGKRIDVLLAYCADNLPNLSFVLTGSEVGMLHDFLGIDDPKAPLFGRRMKTITLRRLGKEEAIDFLKKGLGEMRVAHDEKTLESAVQKLDGIAGWLTHFGYSYATENAQLATFVEKAVKMVDGELRELYKKSDRYRLMLSAIAKGFRKWSDIYKYVEVELGPISRSNFNYLLENLVKMNFVEKLQGGYTIPDPMINEALIQR